MQRSMRVLRGTASPLRAPGTTLATWVLCLVTPWFIAAYASATEATDVQGAGGQQVYVGAVVEHTRGPARPEPVAERSGVHPAMTVHAGSGTWRALTYGDARQWWGSLSWRWFTVVIMLTTAGALGLACMRRRGSMEGRRCAQRDLADVSRHLPVVVYQARRDRDGGVSFPFIMGDVRGLFALSGHAEVFDFAAMIEKVHPEDRALARTAFDHAGPGRTGLDIDFRIDDGGAWRWVNSRAQGVAADDGAMLWSGCLIDMTSKRMEADALSTALSARSELLATLSHEIRSPMDGILGLLDVVVKGPIESSQRETLETIHASVYLLKRLLDDILDLSRMEAGAMQLAADPADLRALVDGVVRILGSNAQKKGLYLDVWIDPALESCHLMDDMRMRQILFNLVGNAIKFTDDGGVSVTIDVMTLEPMGAYRSINDVHQQIRIRVSDTGIGIAAAQQEMLFKPFVQANEGIGRAYGGTGLGLSICHGLITQMKGVIVLHSMVGKGTHVDVELSLPVVTGAATVQQDAAEPAWLPAGMGGLRVLVADDQEVNRTVMAWRMQQLGLVHVMCADGRQALQALAAQRFDLVLTDCRMSVMDGYALATAIRVMEGSAGRARMPIVAMTAGGMADEEERCLAAGMDEVIFKPVTLLQLRQVLLRWLPLDGHADAADVAAATVWSMASREAGVCRREEPECQGGEQAQDAEQITEAGRSMSRTFRIRGRRKDAKAVDA